MWNSISIQGYKFKRNVGFTCDVYLILNGITTDPETGISTVNVAGETYVLGDSADYSVSLLLTIQVANTSAEYSGNNSAGNVYMFLASSNNLSNAGKFKLYNTSQGKNTPISVPRIQLKPLPLITCFAFQQVLS